MDIKTILGLDIGGTHIAGGLITVGSGCIVENSYREFKVDTRANGATIIESWKKAIERILGNEDITRLTGIGLAMPGPFDYEQGISFIKDLGKYDALYGINIREALVEALALPDDFPVYFENDAICFALGEYAAGAVPCKRFIGLTLGTGLGAAFIDDGRPVRRRIGVPPEGTLYNVPCKEGMAEDYFSARGLLNRYAGLKEEPVGDAKIIFDRAIGRELEALETFIDFGKELAAFLVPWLHSFGARCIVLGGNISRASRFFTAAMKEEFDKYQLPVDVIVSGLGEKAAILGAAGLVEQRIGNLENTRQMRRSGQNPLPLRPIINNKNGYTIYPAFQLKENKIQEGWASLAEYIARWKTVVIDGYMGVSWEAVERRLRHLLEQKGLTVYVENTENWFLPQEEIDQLAAPFLGEKESVWGSKCNKALSDFFDKEKISQCSPAPAADINIIIGCGAAMAGWNGPVIYFDVPKNELQYRMRAGSVANLGCTAPGDPAEMYKRCYFVDWVVLNKHKKNVLERIAILADSQRLDTITWMDMKEVKKALQTQAANLFRVRPWFEPGAWGGQWIKKNIEGVNLSEVNYAWSFELITPENGLLLESGGLLLELSFDFLMFLHGKEILGERFAKIFGDEFPIRFDFLDTVGGGNLSIQCHPSTNYIKAHFGENFTQDETYYILDADKGASVYLGFQEHTDPAVFRAELEKSQSENTPVEIENYVQKLAAKKHDFFLIPNGTVHSAARGNLVLEISATPYIFTFKMYDWLRLDLNGKPRPINIAHAFENLDFGLKGKRVEEELISKPEVLDSGEDWRLVHLPTHEKHFYDVHRYEFKGRVQVSTGESCNVLMLVEGTSVTVETKNGFRQRFFYAETFVLPAAAESYMLINEGQKQAKVLKAFLKRRI